MSMIIVHGKSGGKFTAPDGNTVNVYKVSAAVPTEQLTGDWQVVGDSCLQLKVSAEVFNSLPSNYEAYDGGFPCEAEFDYKGRVISLKTA